MSLNAVLLALILPTAPRTDLLAADAEGERHELDSKRRELEAIRVDTAPVVDGRLDDDVWRRAPSSGNLVQADPVEGGEPSERTEFRVVYDEAALYVGIWCYDSEPRRIVAREMARDGNIAFDDSVALAIDTFLDRRNGYWFSVNPNGARSDALITDNAGLNVNWDGIWVARVTIDDEGWKAEFEIPFKTLSFRPEGQIWGINVERVIKRRNEIDRWMSARPEIQVADVADAGNLRGLRGLTQGIGVDVVPYVLGEHAQNREISDEDFDFESGGDVRWRITPNLMASASYNTDFAQTEVDARQINLTRFPLFFPEKRDFFLEDAGIFSFGSAGSSLTPFFSRRIGLDDTGRVAPLLGATKISGRVGNYNVGIVDAVIDGNRDIPVRNALAARVKRNVFKQSSVGGIATWGDPNSEDENGLSGVDYTYRTSELFGDQILEAGVFGLGTYSEDAPDQSLGEAYGANLKFPNDLYQASVSMFEVGKGFRPALGFVPREEIRSYRSQFEYRPRPESIESIRQVRFVYGNNFVTSLSNEMETQTHSFFPFFIRFEDGEDLWFSVRRVFERLDEDFEISESVILPLDDYWGTDYEIGFDSAQHYPVKVQLVTLFGDFFSGTKETYSGQLSLLTSKYFSLSPRYSFNHVRLPEGDFDTNLAAVRLQVNFTPDLTWSNFVQWDDVSETIGFSSRVRWEVRPGTDVFLVVNQNISESVRLIEQTITAKVSVTIRF